MFYSFLEQANLLKPDLEAVEILHSGTEKGKFSLKFYPNKVKES